MQLNQQESSAAFWVGAKQGAVRSLGYIIAIGVPVVGLMLLGVLPPVTITVGIISALSTALTVGMFSGHQAVSQYHQQKHNKLYETKIARLEGIAQQTELAPEEHIQHSPRLSTIIEEGARSASGSFTDAEEERRAEAPKGYTIH